MSKSRPLSLAQYFDPPEGFVGHFGWLCGYSADSDFLNDAAERFIGQTLAQRASIGSVSLALMLDSGCKQINFTSVPGVAHLALKSQDKKRFKLLHAKVALLGFRNEKESSDWRIRLIVSTGNWTRQTLESSLDLAWSVDVSNKELTKKTKDVKVRCADLESADALFLYLKQYFDCSLIDNFFKSEAGALHKDKSGDLQGWLKLCGVVGKGCEPRFFDNRFKSLLKQIPKKLNKLGLNGKRNHLVMASGFYESTVKSKAIPSVIRDIVSDFESEELLTKNVDKNIIVNEDACQAVAKSLYRLQKEKFFVCAAIPPAFIFPEKKQPPRFLHAKFIFSCNKRSSSDRCSNAWLYLGSGNLTKAGFTKKMSRHAGNLEAGVLFSPDLYWKGSRDGSNRSVYDALPVNLDREISDIELLTSGKDMEESEDLYLAPPVSWLQYELDLNGSGVLKVPEGHMSDVDFDVLHGDGLCQKRVNDFIWPDASPREVTVQWGAENQNEAIVPVMDQFGRLAATALRALDLDEASGELMSFPTPPAEEEITGNIDGFLDEVSSEGKRLSGVGEYPVRQMMELLENIADKQTALLEEDWPTWCNRLEQVLSQIMENDVVHYFVNELKINPLSALHEAPFRPEFAESPDSVLGEKYSMLLDRVERQWGVSQLTSLGVRRGA